MGLNKMAVHMFVFYWGMLSSITPPVAIASFAAAGIAGAPAMKTGWESMRVGSIIYFLPFFFVFDPALVLQGSYVQAAWLTAKCVLGIFVICAGIQGYLSFVGNLNRTGSLEWPIRVLLMVGGVMLATARTVGTRLCGETLPVGVASAVTAAMRAAFLLSRRAGAA